MNITPTIQVNIQNRYGRNESAIISKAKLEDMPTDWRCNWVRIFENTQEEYYERIVKMEYKSSAIALMKFSLYFNAPEQVEVVEINNLEALPKGKRIVDPVGRWLIWYASNIALQYCPQDPSSQILFLSSLEDAFSFYKDKIMMEYIEPVTLGPGEDGYAFRFNRANAYRFCEKQEKTYGCPVLL